MKNFSGKKTVLDSDGAKFMGKPGSIVVDSVILLICNRLSCYVFFFKGTGIVIRSLYRHV